MSSKQLSSVRTAKMLVVGAGVLGNKVLKNLVSAGVKDLTVVDSDRVEPHNLKHCGFFDSKSSELKEFKVQAVKRALKRLNRNINLTTLCKNIEEMPDAFVKDFEVVIGCVDNLDARLHINAQSYYYNVPYIDGGINGPAGKVQVVLPPETACLQCSLNATHRRELAQRYSCTGDSRTAFRNSTETEATTAGITAAVQVREALKLISGKKEQVRINIIYYNGTNNQLEVLTVGINPNCPLH